MTIKVGDVVIWRQGMSKSKKGLPLGIAGCEVLEIGETADKEPAARLKLPSVFADRGGGHVCVLIADLEH